MTRSHVTSHVGHDAFICGTWLIYTGHDSFMWRVNEPFHLSTSLFQMSESCPARECCMFYCLFYRSLLQKRPIIYRSLLVAANLLFAMCRGSTGTWMSDVPEWVMSRMNESCPTYEYVITHTQIYFLQRAEVVQGHEWVMSRMSEACPAYECVMPHNQIYYLQCAGAAWRHEWVILRLNESLKRH